MAWIIVSLAIVEAAWLAFDGSRALLVGDYVTPASGAYAGQLGPWATLVSGVGIDPRSTLVKVVHLLLGVTGLGIAATFARRPEWAHRGMLAWAVSTLWYLPFGTVLSAVLLVLLARRRTS